MNNENFIFIAAMTNSGSTLLQSIINSSPNIVGLTDEGIKVIHRFSAKAYPDPGKLGHPRAYTEILDIVRNNNSYDWNKTKQVWFNDWKSSVKYKSLKDKDNLYFVEKTPLNVVICDILQREFVNSRFILMVRNPYAVCEGIIRQLKKSRPHNKMTYARAATHWCKCSEFQIKNIQTLNKNLFFSYEDLSENQENIKLKLEEFIPGSSFNLDEKFKSTKNGNRIVDKIKNMNEEQIARLSKDNINEINKVLDNYKEVIDYFKYELI